MGCFKLVSGKGQRGAKTGASKRGQRSDMAWREAASNIVAGTKNDTGSVRVV
jgi:hypothetical protein